MEVKFILNPQDYRQLQKIAFDKQLNASEMAQRIILKFLEKNGVQA